MSLTRPSAVKKASATALQQYKDARAAREAEKIRRAKMAGAAKVVFLMENRFCDTNCWSQLSIHKDSKQNAPQQSAKRKADDDGDAGQRPKKIAKVCVISHSEVKYYGMTKYLEWRGATRTPEA